MEHKKIVLILIFFILILSSLMASQMKYIQGSNKVISTLTLSIIFTGIFYLILCTYSKEKFHFEVTPEKKCVGGSYMTQSGPNHEYCKKLRSTPKGRESIDKYSCNKGTVGMPKALERTPMSDSSWNNPLCKNLDVTKIAVF